MVLGFVSGTKFIHIANIQWGPTLTSHDPNPPVMVESNKRRAQFSVFDLEVPVQTVSGGGGEYSFGVP